jgi:MurNAc alpha-1-phosphate uridylyltransferase
MKAFILAAGRGQRLKPITDKTPKPLVKVQGKPLLLHHLLALEKAGFRDIVINVSWLGEQIIDFLNTDTPKRLSVRISDERQQALETGGGMLKALKLLGSEPFLSINADVFSDMDYRQFADDSLYDDLLKIALVPNPPHNRQGDFSLDQNRLIPIKPTLNTYTYSGIGVFSPALFNSLRERDNEAFRLAPLIHQAVERQLAVGHIHHGQWTDVGSLQRLAELNRR